ncbi:DUF6495 family protein [Pontibacter sp. G13]|uniref:DUF6495 family protein n=1 Tax=Pontibacter sp. G13 TaxID=3074898 RepID=UPI00288C5624|nr:DUF6495 family protein [Pontibacter sp. G13]WNJ16675.1 DUF6495 family protein [Pontibacter sp. G13]
MKYRRLTDSELAAVEPQLKQFLVAHGVMSDDWRKMNEETPEKAIELVDIFSDTLFDSMLKNVQYMMHVSAKDLRVFKCGETMLSLLGLKVVGDTPVAFTESPWSEDLVRAIQEAGGQHLQSVRTMKPYETKDRELELFKMMESGCVMTAVQIWDLLDTLIPESGESA